MVGAQCSGHHVITQRGVAMKTTIIGLLLVGVGVLGYLYYQSTRNDITIKVPSIELKQ
jgi:Tfp pilus assembly protein PilV